MAHYYRAHGDYRPLAFAIGTAATFAKELIRLGFVERKVTKTGWNNLWRGMRDAWRLSRDKSFEIMAPLAQ
jgi:hypothetical protein